MIYAPVGFESGWDRERGREGDDEQLKGKILQIDVDHGNYWAGRGS